MYELLDIIMLYNVKRVELFHEISKSLKAKKN